MKPGDIVVFTMDYKYLKKGDGGVVEECTYGRLTGQPISIVRVSLYALETILNSLGVIEKVGEVPDGDATVL